MHESAMHLSWLTCDTLFGTLDFLVICHRHFSCSITYVPLVEVSLYATKAVWSASITLL